MKNVAICYSEHAIKVSDSYCSGPSNLTRNLAPSIQDSVTCIYKVKLSSEKQIRIRITWCNRITPQGFSIGVSDDYPFYPSKFSKNTRLIRKARGTKAFESCGMKMELLWDLYRAGYESGPQPINGFYVLFFVNSELGLILGDMDKELEVKKRISGIQLSQFSLISRSEHFSGNSAAYSTRAKFCDTGTCHDISIECFGGDKLKFKSPILSIYIDKKIVIEVKKLQWNFRGNQIMFLDGLLVDMMWDVHDWFFNEKPGSGCGVFMFRTRSGLDSRLWLEEQAEHKTGFSLLICASKNPD